LDRVWETLLDLERVATFLPGAKVESADDGLFSGSMRVKVGPMVVTYRGTARLVDVNEDERSAAIEIQARDTSGQGTAAAVIRSRLVAMGDNTQVTSETDLQITGRQAQFGRGIMQDIAGRMIQDFARRFEEYLTSSTAGSSSVDGTNDQRGAFVGSDEVLDLGSALTHTVASKAVAAIALIVVASIVLRRPKRGLSIKIVRGW
jgi:carbon monoxide dehydrogenase subunit G